MNPTPSTALLVLLSLSACGVGVAPDDDPVASREAASTARAAPPDPADPCDAVVCPTGRICIAGVCQCGPGDQPCLPLSCGGFGNFPCPRGNTCVDDPSDKCNPKNGGADCPGICVPVCISSTGC